MIQSPVTLTLQTPDETARFAAKMGVHLQAGDCLLLEGPIGAGKTHFARHLIQSLLTSPEDVPSPTFTLVQTYETKAGEVWHADLYRLTSLDEVEELGLTDAFDQAICLVEWPDRLGPSAPANALTLTLSQSSRDEGTRQLALNWKDDRWARVLGRVLQ